MRHNPLFDTDAPQAALPGYRVRPDVQAMGWLSFVNPLAYNTTLLLALHNRKVHQWA